MALKDWKKVGKYSWRNNKVKLVLEIEKDSILKRFDVKIMTGLAPSQQRFLNFNDSFKIKPQALKFAKSYMRTH